jgi:hypothetical protein
MFTCTNLLLVSIEHILISTEYVRPETFISNTFRCSEHRKKHLQSVKEPATRSHGDHAIQIPSRSILILSCDICLILHKVSFLQVFPSKTLYEFMIFNIFYMPHPSHLVVFNYPNVLAPMSMTAWSKA